MCGGDADDFHGIEYFGKTLMIFAMFVTNTKIRLM